MYPYQLHCVDHIIRHPASGLFLEMGLGKTISTLTAINVLKYEFFEVSKVLVIAPKRVAETVWSGEIANWEHIRHLTFSKVMGTVAERKRALLQKADIHIINRENVAWLVTHYGTAFPFDMVVIDELSSFKSAKSQRFKALRRVRPLVRRVVGLTGTPAPNTLMDLWPQMYLLDRGERLGKFIGYYREKYFNPGRRNGHVVYNYTDKKDLDKQLFGVNPYHAEIYDKISDICISMKTEDYRDMPPTIYRDIRVELTPQQREQYDDFEKKQVLQLFDPDTADRGLLSADHEETEISAVNAAALSTKLLQYASGAVYDEEKNWHVTHNAKLEALEELIDVATSPVLIFYWFKHDLERMEKHLHKYKPRNIKEQGAIEDWNTGKIRVLFAHPASAGHGLNLQFGGHNIIWFSQTWSLELYQQANARLPRPGQKNAVIIHNLITTGTMDEDVMMSRAEKDFGQEALMQAVKARVKKIMKSEIINSF